MATTDIGRAVPLLRGEYDPAQTYELNDIVSLNGSLYWHYSHEVTTNVAPQATSTWKVVLSLTDAEAYIARAESAAEEAESAKDDAVTAKTAAETASATATGASEAATAAKDDAVTARNAAQTAETGAVEAKNAAVSAKEAAQSAASSAGTSATSAGNSAGTAEYYATNAETAAETATTKASEASASAATASSAATTATEAKNTAVSSASTATTKAGEASTSATSAASSAAAAQAVKDSIPQDYTALSNDVSDLKTQLDDVTGDTVNFFDPKYLADITDWSETDGVYSGPVNKLYNAYHATNYPIDKAFDSSKTYSIALDGKMLTDPTTGVGLKVIFRYTDDTNETVIQIRNNQTTFEHYFGTATKPLAGVRFDYGTGTGTAYIKNIVLFEGTADRDYIPYTTAVDFTAREEIEKINDDISGIETEISALPYVSTETQSLTSGQKLRARTNIEAVSQDERTTDISIINDEFNGKTHVQETFVSGTYQNNGTEINSDKYIRCGVFSVPKTSVLRIKSGWEFAVWFYKDDGTTRIRTTPTLDSNDALLVAQGEKIKLTIHKEDDSYIALHIEESALNLYYDNNYLPSIENELITIGRNLVSRDFTLGKTDNTGALVPNNGFACTKNIIKYNKKVLVHADDGYLFGIAYYDDQGVFIDEVTATKYDIIIDKNVYFRLTIRKTVWSDSDINVLDFISHVTINAFDLDEKPSHEWWFYPFGIAHTGADGYCPNNTTISFKYAIKELGMKMMEADLRFTSDSVPVLLHNATINQTARNSDGTEIEDTVYIASITYDEALEYDFGIYMGDEFAGTKIGTLEDLLKLCYDTGTYLLLDIKAMTSAQAEIVVAMIKKYQMDKKIAISTTPSSTVYYRYLWQYLDYPVYCYNLLEIPQAGTDETIRILNRFNKNGNICVDLYNTEFEKTTEINKLINAGFGINNSSNASDAQLLLLPEFIRWSSAHHDYQEVRRTAALAN